MERSPAGLAAKTFDETAAKNLQPDIYYPIENQDNRTCKIVSHAPQDMVHGISTKKSESVQKTFAAMQRSQVMLALDEVAEQIYASNKTEPLGKSRIYGYALPSNDFVFGNRTDNKTEAIAETLFPSDMNTVESEHVRALYRKTHKDFDPGEQRVRGYRLPAAILKTSDFKYGIPSQCTSGSVTECLRWSRD
jgi:hypothetical protein